MLAYHCRLLFNCILILFDMLYLLYFQITTHSHLLSSMEIKDLGKNLGFAENQTASFLLQEFDTELDFTKAIE